MTLDNAEIVGEFELNENNPNIVMISVLGVIEAGIFIEIQEDILEYVDIPKNRTKGGKTYYGLKISDDSMFPKYLENNIVIFEQSEDYVMANKKSSC